MNLEELRTYLPKYLSPESEEDLFRELRQFPDNLDQRLYAVVPSYEETILQGDGLSDLLIINLPAPEFRPSPAIVLSNTCDIEPSNHRLFGSRICYCPLLNFEKYQHSLLKRFDQGRVSSFLESVKKQRVSQVLYLPKWGDMEFDRLAFLDRICSCDNASVSRENMGTRRIFRLSNYGLYLFLFKLSVHFTRIREEIDRYPVAG